MLRIPVMVEHYDKFLESQGYHPLSEFLEQPSLAPLPKEIAALMHLPEGTMAPHRLLRQGAMVGNKPVYTRISDNYYHPEIVTASILAKMQSDPKFNTMQAIREKNGKVPVRFHSDAIARWPNERERKLLDVARTAPILQVIGVNYAEDDTVVFVNQRSFVGDYWELSYDDVISYWKDSKSA